MSCTGIYAQQKTTEAGVEEIRAAFKEINSNKTYKKETYTFDAPGCVEDGRMEYYLDKQQIVKIKETGVIGDGGWDTEYYYRNGNLIFIFESLIGGPANGPIQKSEYRVYVKDGKVIRFMDGQKIIPADNKAAEMTATGVKLLTARTTKKFAEALCGN
ncbi:hypothetical protein A4H97_32815 [Niastella yeongjuensis]|uniref:Uncharacterized protein n=2 Tax=Niastella yeongjuensis TaxID=354355 RepID=A0A1V9EG79_9BACT|nr:hypothetical protein A4H97_32815 [Niastella yeongjuensis]